MKVSLFLFAILALVSSDYTSQAQVGKITTFANVSACNIAIDGAGHLYRADSSHVYKIDSGGAETLVAGGGSLYGDGGAATSAQFSRSMNLAFDHAGNMYIADDGFGVIRKVNSAGIISTVAGNHSLGRGYSGDGGAATAAQIGASHVCVDMSGNLFIADASHSVVRKVNTAGIITTVAGNGSTGHSGDGGPATAAKISFYSPRNNYGITTDPSGNLYISEGNTYYIRKVTPGGIITSIAGNGTTTPHTEGVAATSVGIYSPQNLTTDAAGNLFVTEWENAVLTCIKPTGIINTIAGNYTTGYSGDGGQATAAEMNSVTDVAIDPNGSIYIADYFNSRIRKVSETYLSSTYLADSFGISINNLCAGPQVYVSTSSYNPAYTVKCYFGDGTSVTSALTAGYFGAGIATINHAYQSSGAYTIKALLMNAGVVFDSLSFTFDYRMCNTLSVNYYIDANNNCVFDAGDYHLLLPVLIEVDSNGIAIDNISSTSGIYYTAYGNPGDIYSFKFISYPGNLRPTCPASGIVSDTIQSGIYNTNQKSVAMMCTSIPGFDLGVNALVPVTGVHDQWGNIYVNNAYCLPENATVTLHYSKHYMANFGGFGVDARPIPASYTDSTITWNVNDLSSNALAPVDLYYAIWVNPDSGLVVGYPAKSYYTIEPTTGDVNPLNNIEIRIDTVRAGCDPNFMTVTPSGNIMPGTQLNYKINFTNTGTDTAYNIYVMDTLSDNVDISSFRIVMATATMNVAKLKSGGHNILKFDFPGINLLDSISNPQSCSGGVIFTINAKTGLAPGTTIYNQAGVFFDYNPAVITNITEDIIGVPSDIQNMNQNASEIQLYPNPVSSKLTISATEQITSVVITNPLGQTVFLQHYDSQNVQADVSGLPAGIYFVKINDTEIRKFVKQ